MSKTGTKTSYKTYAFKSEHSYEELIDIIGSRDKITLDGTAVNFKSLRLQTFLRKGNVCAKCGRVGSTFRVQKTKKDKVYHVGLWSDDKIQMTKDHIVPKSKGGKDRIGNMQCLCEICNWEKASIDNNVFMKGSL